MANCICTEYLTFALFQTAVNATDDTKYLGSFDFKESGTGKTKFVLITKT